MADLTFGFELPERDARPDLPPLRGSTRQCEWAEKIRTGKLRGCEHVIRELQRLEESYRQAGREEAAEQARTRLRRLLDALAGLEQKTSAGWWIDRRDSTPTELLEDAPANPGSDFGWER